MSVFTQLCQKVRIDLAEDTITLYPRKELLKRYALNNNRDALEVTVSYNKPFPETKNIVKFRSSELKRKGFTLVENTINENDQNDLVPEVAPYQLRCDKTIDQAILENLLNVFIKNGLITLTEKINFLSSYHSAHSNEILPEFAKENRPVMYAANENSPTFFSTSPFKVYPQCEQDYPILK